MNVVIVESPAKAKTINKYLGKDYTVLASFGHIRDLPSKNGSVDPDADFAMQWELTDRAPSTLKDIQQAIAKADTVLLATDPDREGEAISWHITQTLNDKKLLKGKTVKRVVFNEITKRAIVDAVQNPREIDQDLVDAYLTRRALDYLVGFTLSPVLWRKLPGSRSAGRVQSVALRLICEREAEIEAFKAEEYWTIAATLTTPTNEEFTARLTHLNGRKLDKFALRNESTATAAVNAIRKNPLAVTSIERKSVKRHPYAPFRTSTLQQEASRKLGFGASRTMKTAQRLYEGADIGGETVGLITYMRTDGTTLSGDAIAATRSFTGREYGDHYVPSAPRVYTSKQLNAQEAHEAIRPTDVSRTPDSVRKYLDEDEFRLYTLIWQRTLACQMESAVLDQMSVDIADGANTVTLRATGSAIQFDGFLKVYREDRDDKSDDDDDDDDKDRILPAMKEKDPTATRAVEPKRHFTEPPPRYSEASLVKKLEELGIGRPSTYASIIQVLQDRDYVRIEQKRFLPEDRGRIVTAFLMNYFSRYVEYDFTAKLEEELDEVAEGKFKWKNVLRAFWTDFKLAVDGTAELRISDVLSKLDADLSVHLYPPSTDGTDPRACPNCKNGSLHLKVGKFGAFLGCSNYPDCRYTRQLSASEESKAEAATKVAVSEPKELGIDTKTGQMITLRVGPYGPYLQIDIPAAPVVEDAAPELTKAGKPKKPRKKAAPKPTVKRFPVPKDVSIDTLDLPTAIRICSLPRDVGVHPETGDKILAGVGRFGPYLKVGEKFVSLPKSDDVLTIGINRAVEVIAEKAKRAAEGGGKRRGGFKRKKKAE